MFGNSSKFFLFLLFHLYGLFSEAQISVGLKESALGNSGAAISESSAPSFYNPALLSEKRKSYFSLTGTTLTSFKSSSESGDFNSTKFAPNYLSSIHAFESFIHEFSLANQVSIDSRSVTPLNNGSRTIDIRSDQYALSYSMAFRDFPFGFQIGTRINEEVLYFNQNINDGNSATGTSVNKSERIGYLFLGFGGIHQLGTHYRFGYKYESRGLMVYKKTDQAGTYYSYDKSANQFTSGKTTITDNESHNPSPQSITLGHSFLITDHEFLTDSRLVEKIDDQNSYSFTQTLGYKITFSNKMQFMCGTAHSFKPDSNDLTKSNTFSAGFAWQTNTLQSTINAYHADAEDGSTVNGFTLGSEFIY